MSEDVTFDPVGRMPRLSDTIAERLLDAIVAGRFRAGDIMPSERELGVQFGVSRTVIREAIRALATRGLVEVQSGRGVRVMQLDTAPVTAAMSLLLRGSDIDFIKLHEVRTILERHTAGLAAEHGTEQNHAELEELVRNLAAAEAVHDIDVASRLDIEFHRAVAKSTRNELFLVLLDSISAALLENRRATLSMPHDPARVLAEHRRILEAIENHDVPGARAAMDEHLEHVAKAWRAQTGAAKDGAGVTGSSSD